MTQESKQQSPLKGFFKGVGFMFSLFGRVFRILFLVALVLGLLFGIFYVMELDEQVKKKFDGSRWELPARVFARPLEMYKGQQLYADHLEQELKLLNYRKVANPRETGQFYRKNNRFVINTRGFQFAEDMEPARSIKVSIRKGKISSLKYADEQEPLDLMRLEPVLIGNFYPRHHEDRVLVKLKNVPGILVNGLIAVEDRKFYEHQGVNPVAIGRALIANLKAGHTVQGGSTLTQQLVKNFYLTNERKWDRKMKEAVMAFLLDRRYEKDEILEAYLNEIHLGQDGDRAIHGFGLAAQFYFNRPLRELKPHQIALLIGIAKGSGYYNPRSRPERALERRNLVLKVMLSEGVITQQQYADSIEQPLGVSEKRPSGTSPFPAYMDLVRQQLQRDYKEEDLRSKGLLIFTSMDPIVQLTAEKILRKRVSRLERAHRIKKGKLNAAMIISSVQGGEVSALVGGRDVRYAGYNRALSARRQIGSLVKPAIFLAALENPRRYTLSKLINDGPVTVKLGRKKYWQPRNYDRRSLGAVTLLKALTSSRNTPAVRVGVALGIGKVVDTLHDLGIGVEIPEYPSILLGALEMSPMDVQQMYQTLAARGTYSPLKSIRSVMDERGRVLTRYPLTVKQVASREATDLLNYALHRVTREGTAKALAKTLPDWKKVAGKTGTTNDKKDSWFAGFSGEHVVTVWVGRDDNKPTGMTGGSGALKVWSDLFRVLPTKALPIGRSSRLVWLDIDKASGLRHNPACGSSIKMPFIKGSQPQKTSYCAQPEVPEEEELMQPATTGAPVAAQPQARPQAQPSRQPVDRSSWIDDLMQ